MAVEIHGFYEPQFEKMKDAFLQNFKDGLEVGASSAVTVNGKYVVACMHMSCLHHLVETPVTSKNESTLYLTLQRLTRFLSHFHFPVSTQR